MAKTYLTPKEITRMESAAKNLRDKLLIRLLFHLGCRVSEVMALESKHIDFEQQMVTIQHLKTRFQLSCPKCGTRLGRSHSYCPRCGEKVKEAVIKEQAHRRIRTLPLDKETLKMLDDYIKRGGTVKHGDKILVFGINRHRAWQIVKELAGKVGLPKLTNPETGRTHYVSPHRIRDAFAVNAVKVDDSGDGLRLLQEHLGHTSFNTTARYRKVSGEEHKEWFDKLWGTKR